MVRLDNLHPTVFLINFGLAQLFCNPAMYLHNPDSTDQPVVGTLPFTSIAGHRGFAQSCRDDLESLVYTIIYSARGDLPWTTISPNGADSNQEAVLQKKKSITVEELCKGLPAPFCKFVSYVHSLVFDKKPDYKYLHSILLLCSATETGHSSKAQRLFARPLANVDRTPVFSGRV
jgi:hypothetical protein